MERLRHRSRSEILLQRQRLLEECMRVAQSVLALSHAKTAKILATRVKLLHVARGEQREAAIRTAGAVRIDRVLRELTEVTDRLSERVDLIRVGTDAGDHRSIAGLHCAKRATQSDHARSTTHRDLIQPTQGQPEVLRDADC